MRKAVLILMATFVFSSYASAQAPSAWADKLFGGTTTHDFGVVARGTQLKYSFPFTNIYKVPLEVSEVRVSCGCVKAEPSTRVLQPSETAQLSVSMDARQFSGQKTVRIYVTVGPKYVSTATLTVSAQARGDVVFAPPEIDFSGTQHGATASKYVDLEYTGTLADWRVTEIVKSGTAPFELKVEELPPLPTGAQRRGYRIVATLKADASPGPFNQEITLKTSDLSAPVLTYHIVGNVQAGLAVSPSPVIVSGLRVGESQTKKVFVRASRPFRILGVEGQGDGVTVEVPNRNETTQVLTVNFQPMRAGDFRRQLMIRTDMGGETTPIVLEATIEP